MTPTLTAALTLTGAQWRALDTHLATERYRYAMEYVAHLPASDASRSWITSDGVAVATDGKRAIYLPVPTRPADVQLATMPKVSKAKRAQADTYPGATLPDGTDGRFYPPALDVIPTRGTGTEIPTDSLRAIFAPFAVDPDNDTVGCWFGPSGVRLAARSAVTDTTVTASWGTTPDGEGDPIGLGARYVLDVCDAADLLGVSLLTLQWKDHRSAVAFGLGSKALAIVMPRVL